MSSKRVCALLVQLHCALSLCPTVCIGGKVLVIYADGLSGITYYRYTRDHLALQFIEKQGVWSDTLEGVFPTQRLPTLWSLFTGQLPRQHGFVADYFRSNITRSTFLGGMSPASDLRADWWLEPAHAPPLWSSARRAGASMAMLNVPLYCAAPVDRPRTCTPYTPAFTLADNHQTLINLTRTNDIVFVYDDHIIREAQLVGLSLMHGSASRRRTNSVAKLFDYVQTLLEHVRTHELDLNVLVVSGNGLTEVHSTNQRFLEDYIDMDLIETTIGFGALKHVIAKEGQIDRVFDLLTRKPIPQVRIYRTDPKRTQLDERYWYTQSERIADLILIATPGYWIRTKRAGKQMPEPSNEDYVQAASGFNHVYPDMMGVLLGYGPGLCVRRPSHMCRSAFARGHRAVGLRLFDVYALICRVARLRTCSTIGDGRLSQENRLLSDAYMTQADERSRTYVTAAAATVFSDDALTRCSLLMVLLLCNRLFVL